MLTQLRIDERDRSQASPSEREILDLEPELDDRALLVLECWCDLDSERPLGFSAPGAIPWRAVRAWCRWNDLDRPLTTMMLDVIRYLDAQRAERISSELAHRNGG